MGKRAEGGEIDERKRPEIVERMIDDFLLLFDLTAVQNAFMRISEE